MLKGSTYKISEFDLSYATDQQIQQWSADPHCANRDECTAALAQRKIDRARQLEQSRRPELIHPFDVRSEISADAKYISTQIVRNLWIICAVLCFVIALLFLIFR